MAKRFKSALWEHFTVDVTDLSKVNCRLCGSKLSRGGKTQSSFTTSNLRKHLRSLHKTQYEAVEKEENELCNSANVTTSYAQPTIAESFGRSLPLPPSSERATTITKLIGEFIAGGMHPYIIVEEGEFQRLVKYLEPRYVLPSEKHFRKTVVPDLHSKLRATIVDLVSKQDFVSLTADIWSSPAQDSYLGITSHFITKDFEKKQAVLHVMPFNESHTGDNIFSELLSCLDEWSIKDKLHVVVRDNGSNFVNAFRNTIMEDVPCLAHTLQLVINDGVLKQRCVEQLRAIARKLVGSFKHSPLASNALKKIQEEKGVVQHKLVQCQDTRWNSTYYMLERLLEQKRAVTAAIQQLKIPHKLKPDEWELSTRVVKILQVFEETTKLLSYDSASVSEVIPIINSLFSFLDPDPEEQLEGGNQDEDDQGTKSMKRAMLLSLEKRHINLENKPTYAFATLLDPRFKEKPFKKEQALLRTKAGLLTELETLTLQVGSGDSQLTTSRSNETNVGKSGNKSQILGLMSKLLSTTGTTRGQVCEHDSARSVFNAYLQEPNTEYFSNPLDYWKAKDCVENQHWKGLAKLARKYLSAPATTVPSERLFSVAGQICNDLRSSLKPENVEMLLFLKCNLKMKLTV